MRKYADFNGRASRREYWWFYLAMQLIALPFSFFFAFAYVALFFPVFGAGVSGTPDEVAISDLNWGPLLVSGALLMVVGLVFALPSYAAQARRLHDTGQSGLWVLLNFASLGIVPLIMCVLEPTPGENQYGPDPREAVSA